MEEIANSISLQYMFNNLIYDVSANEDFHMKIRNDTQFAANYFQQISKNFQVQKCSVEINENDSAVSIDETTGDNHEITTIQPEGATDIAINSAAITTTNEFDVSRKKQKVMQQCPDEAAADDEVWDNDSIKFLLNEYFIRKERLRNSKTKRIVLWREIEAEFKKVYRTFSAIELSKKFSNMKLTYSKIKENNSKKTTGTGRKSWPWLAQMDEIFHNDVSINFTSEVLASMPADENAQPINLSSQATSPTTEDASTSNTASQASTSEVSLFDESSSEAPPNCFKSARGKKMYYHRQKQLQLDAEKLDMMRTWNNKFIENKKLQEKALT